MIVNYAPKSVKTYECDLCHFITCRKIDFSRHLSTDKHKKKGYDSVFQQNDSVFQQNDSVFISESANFAPSSAKIYQCDCGKTYRYDSGYYRHKKVCQESTKESSKEPAASAVVSNTVVDKDLVIMLINDNKELRNMLLEQAKEKEELKTMMLEMMKNGGNNMNSNNTNCNNKAFNLNFFLNETCKNAMNMTEFLDSIKVQLSDLERFGEVGYVEGISDIITNNLKQMDITERPVHCTDRKRETIYIKDDNKWEKEDDNKSKLKRLIKRVEIKNHKLLPAYREKYLGCQYSDSKFSDRYNKMMVEVMGGSGNDDAEKQEKIIHNISKNVIVDK